MKNLRPLLFFVSLILIVGLACRFGADAPQAPTEKPVIEEPTTAPEPTEEPTEPPIAEPTAEPTELPTEAPVVSQFFIEEFDQDPGPFWEMAIIGPGAEKNEDEVKTEFSNSRMRIELPERDLYFYYTFLGYTYEDVRLDLRADNRGVNTNNVSLICRLSEDGWYEWSVGSGGDWILYASTDTKKYNMIAKGGTTYLKQGKEVNEYGLECKGDSIGMFINGQEIKQSPFKDTKYGLGEGTVAFNISSLHVTPVVVEVDWFKVSEP
jgi:hypothetical protein